jgi:hypothetical protein
MQCDLVPGRNNMGETVRKRVNDGRCRVVPSLGAGFGLALVLMLVPVSGGSSQAPGQNVGPPGTVRPYYPGPTSSISSSGGFEAAEAERRLKELNHERQKEMISDTNKLLKLATELNDEVAATKAEALTYDQLHRIAQIEKLAHNVREKMTLAAQREGQSGVQ